MSDLSDEMDSRGYEQWEDDFVRVLQPCLRCNTKISAFPGSRGAVCPVCGYKDPCCE